MRVPVLDFTARAKNCDNKRSFGNTTSSGAKVLLDSIPQHFPRFDKANTVVQNVGEFSSEIISKVAKVIQAEKHPRNLSWERLA